MSVVDTNDWNKIPGQPIAAGSLLTIGTNTDVVWVDPGASGAIRLWSMDIGVFNADPNNPLVVQAYLDTTPSQVVAVQLAPVAPSATVESLAQGTRHYGGVILHRGAKLRLSCSSNTGGGAVYATVVTSVA